MCFFAVKCLHDGVTFLPTAVCLHLLRLSSFLYSQPSFHGYYSTIKLSFFPLICLVLFLHYLFCERIDDGRNLRRYVLCLVLIFIFQRILRIYWFLLFLRYDLFSSHFLLNLLVIDESMCVCIVCILFVCNLRTVPCPRSIALSSFSFIGVVVSPLGSALIFVSFSLHVLHHCWHRLLLYNLLCIKILK